VTLIPVGAPLRINGCLAETPWCDVSFAGGRGWVAGRYVQALYQQRRVYVDPQYYRPLGIPTITFDLDNYWDRNYRGRDFYRDRDRWARGPDWQRNGGNPVYRRPPPVYDPQDDDQGNWQRQRPPAYDPGYDQGDDNPSPRFRPRYNNDDGQPRYGSQPDQGNFDGDNNPPPRRRPQQPPADQAQQPQPQQQQQQQQRPPRQQPPQGQPPRQQPQQPQHPPAPQPQAQQPPQPPKPQAQQPAGNAPPRLIRRNDGQVVSCPAGSACVEPHSSHN
jgi:hypothetical protein